MLKTLSVLAAFAAFLATAAAGNAAPLKAQDVTDLNKISAYLNTITSLQASFVQVGPNGELDQGTIFARKPGRLRFEYAPPSPYLIVSDGVTIAVANQKLRTVDRYPLIDNPLSLILREGVDLTKDSRITGVERQAGTLRVTATEKSGPVKGQVTLIFAYPATELRQWIITDAQGLQTMIALKNMKTEVQLNPELFILRDVDRFGRRTE
ncbi:MAG: outer membrane lipoprotein carrier protein LolA [Alphaproteobacteria bacterium]|jgi:outer membrane lipoprotein-sorting protein|nr:outer membrane lipoprotein carrier protein LolA [Alphaproteobacteria bacterium]